MGKEDLIKAGHKIFRYHVYRTIKTFLPKLQGVKVVGKIDIENTQHDSHKYIIKYGDWYLCVKITPRIREKCSTAIGAMILRMQKKSDMPLTPQLYLN